MTREVVKLPMAILSLPRVPAELLAEMALEMTNSRKLGESADCGNWQQPPQQTSFESDKNLDGGLRASGDGFPTPEDSTSTQADWRALAQRVQAENDPGKMIELVQQLIAKIDEERLQKPFRPISQTL